MARCRLCGEEGPLVSGAIGACAACLRSGSTRARRLARAVHERLRPGLGVPARAVSDAACVPCTVCANLCQPGEGERGLCGTRARQGRAVVPVVGTPAAAAVSVRHDPLPTNCCARFVCAGCTSSGYPGYTDVRGAEHGFQNLAVGYYGCTFNCLYCQSWEVLGAVEGPRRSAEEVAAEADASTRCICFFGGDPTAQLGHALETGRLARRRARAEGRHLRLCFETNGAMHPKLLDQMIELALESGGCIKFDLKAFDPTVHEALCGAPAARVFENFATLAARAKERPRLPLAIAATTLVPGYVDVEEVEPIARFLAGLDVKLPYLLLGCFSCHHLADLPNTSKQQARRCQVAARGAGLKKVRLENQHLLRDAPGEAQARMRRMPRSATSSRIG